MSRQTLLTILQQRCEALGVRLRFSTEVADLGAFADADLILAADGVNSWVRGRHAEWFGPSIDWRPNRFVWLGTTCPFPAFTFIFKEDRHGLWRVHAYRYNREHSTFILETTEATWRAAGLDAADEAATAAFAERLFAEELQGHRMLTNRSLWRQFPTVSNARWHHERVVLVGDAAHTAHFSIGSGTKLAMEDAIALAAQVRAHRDIPEALAAYEAERRPHVDALQRAAQTSLEWFESTERYHGRLEPPQFAFSLLTRSLRVSHDNLRTRDATLVDAVDRWFAERAAAQSGRAVSVTPPPAPLHTPFRLRDVVLDSRIVTSIPGEGAPRDAGLVLLRAGAGDLRRVVDTVRLGTGAKVGARVGVGDASAVARSADAGADLLELDAGERPRAAAEAFAALRTGWPSTRPVALRIVVCPDAVEEAVQVARALAGRGCDLVSLAAAGDDAARADLAIISLSDRIRHEAGVPTMVPARLGSRADADSILAAGRADLCVL
jgi:2-polyprenyl-6-methoxyphenol hydroxylase-like FAD-dependent oxidoreductase